MNGFRELNRASWTGVAALAALSLGLSSCSSLPNLGGPVRAPVTCTDFTVSIYFERDSVDITREAAAIMKAAGDRTKGCKVAQVDVLGLSDAVGDSQTNLAISQRRAANVTSALARRGFSKVEFKVGAAGDAGAETASGEARPLRRRVDVIFHQGPK